MLTLPPAIIHTSWKGYRRKIFIVDDSEADLDRLLEILGDEYDIRVASDGKSALRAMTDMLPDLILLDVMMPDMNGYQVYEQLMCNVEMRNIPVIFLTALSDNIDKERGLQLGVADFISKPFRPQLVQLRIRQQLELKTHRDHLEDQVDERTRDLKRAHDATITAMAILAEYRDNETGAHIQRTTHFVKVIARQLAQAQPEILSPAVIELLGQSAPLHDIGKIGIPDSILLKPGRLTETETAEMQRHTLLGAAAIRKTELVLDSNSFLFFSREIAESHHEKWDGSGYPLGLRGEEIPLSARIMALADVYDALTSIRPYKPSFTHEEAVRIITQGDDRTKPDHFDPRVLTAFIAVHEEFRRIVQGFSDRVGE